MKKLLLLVGLVVFLVTSFAYSWDGPDEYKIYLKEKKKCLLDHMLEIDNDRASKEIDKACDVVGEIATGARDHNAKYWDEEIFFANCVFKNIHKASDKNNRAAALIGKACRLLGVLSVGGYKNNVEGPQYYRDIASCVLENISKSKSDGSAKSIGNICKMGEVW